MESGVLLWMSRLWSCWFARNKNQAPWPESHGAVNETEQRLTCHIDGPLVFPVAGCDVRRLGVLPPKAKPELLEAFTVHGRDVVLCSDLAC
jgi:hypothetical protein